MAASCYHTDENRMEQVAKKIKSGHNSLKTWISGNIFMWKCPPATFLLSKSSKLPTFSHLREIVLKYWAMSGRSSKIVFFHAIIYMYSPLDTLYRQINFFLCSQEKNISGFKTGSLVNSIVLFLFLAPILHGHLF